jgi:phospholipid/cholesterol/gamma-HCH transport system substrate-binding protein
MANGSDTRKLLRVGAVVALSLVTLMIFVFFIGSESRVFSRKQQYEVLLETASGLAEGNPVQMGGVTVGVVRSIDLPRDPKDPSVRISIEVERKYAQRIRTDSRARLRKLGLIAADSYIDISLGSPENPVLAAGSVIPAHKALDADRLIASGEDLVDNFVHISHSLKNVLERVDRGEGLLGELTTDPASRQRITDTVMVTLNRTNEVLGQIQSGRGLIGTLMYDEDYARRLTASIDASARSVQSILASLQFGVERGEGAIPAMLSDPRGRTDLLATLENVRLTSENMSALTAGMRDGEGLIPRLMTDREYADEALAEFQLLVSNLTQTVSRINDGEGTAGRLISDPSIYEAVNDILIGINESRMLRWLIRNRQGAGIQTRYEAARSESGTPAAAPAPAAAAVPASAPVVPPPPAEPEEIVPPVSQREAAPEDGDDGSPPVAVATPPATPPLP